MKRRALTLVEILTVITILAILAAILMPVLSAAKLSAKKAVCINQLRQLGVALQLYSEDSNGDFPTEITSYDQSIIRSVDLIASYGAKDIMRCPLDTPIGRGRQLGNNLQIPRSYSFSWILWEGESGVVAWKRLLELDSNPVIARCNFHDQRVASYLLSAGNLSQFGSFQNGLGLVLKKDLSVSLDRRGTPSRVIQGTSKVDTHLKKWLVATTVECPTDICNGDENSMSFRED